MVWICKVDVIYPQTSDISRTFVNNVIAYHSDVVGASPVGADPTTQLKYFKATGLGFFHATLKGFDSIIFVKSLDRMLSTTALKHFQKL